MTSGEEAQETAPESREENEITPEIEEIQEETRQLEDAAVDSEALIQREQEVEVADQVHTEVVEVVDSVEEFEPSQEGEAIPLPIPSPAEDSGGEADIDPIPIPSPDLDSVSEVEVSPVPIPSPDVDSAGEAEVDPVPIPSPTEDRGGEAEVNPVPIPSPRVESGGPGVDEDISIDPVPIPSPTEPGQETASPSAPRMEKELPEGGQMQEQYGQQEDLQDLVDGDLGSLMPGESEIVGADGKKIGGSKFGDGLKGIPGMGSGGKIDGSSEDPSGDQFAGKGMFKPGKGPRGGEMESDVPGAKDSSTWTNDERDAYVSGKAGAPEKDSAAKEKSLQEIALDDYEITQAILSEDEEEEEKLRKQYGGSKSEISSMESTPEEEGGSDVKAVTQDELNAVLEHAGGDLISNEDPDDQSGEEPDGRLKPEAAKKLKETMKEAASSKHKQKKAGAELITDPDQEDEEKGDLEKNLGKKGEV